MAPPFPSFTPTWHTEPYAAQSPTAPAVQSSLKGKSAIVTGGGGAIGCATAKSLAKGGVAHILITGRRTGPLEEAKRTIEKEVPDVKVVVASADVTKAEDLEKAFGSFKDSVGAPIDILVANAGYFPSVEGVLEADVKDWWMGFEINVLGAFHTYRSFVKVARKDGIIVNVSTGPVHTPALPKFSSYLSSKLAGVKVLDTLHVEVPEMRIVHVHPGVIASEINTKSGIPPMDHEDLAANLIAWACSDEATFLNGKFVWANWDLDELKNRKDDIRNSRLLTTALEGLSADFSF